MSELHRNVTNNWVSALFAAESELPEFDERFDDSCHEALDAELMEFGLEDRARIPGLTHNITPLNFVNIRRALNSQQRTIHGS